MDLIHGKGAVEIISALGAGEADLRLGPFDPF
mgnify:CR=1 FL=1